MDTHPENYLVVAADYSSFFHDKIKRPERRSVEAKNFVLELVDELKPTKVMIKLESALRGGEYGYGLINHVHSRGMKVFADAKLYGIKSTLEEDARFLLEAKPEVVTIACQSGMQTLRSFKDLLPNSEVLGITVPTSFTEDDCQDVYFCSIAAAVSHFTKMAAMAGLNGVVASPHEVKLVRNSSSRFLSVYTPNVRPTWAKVSSETQNMGRSATPFEAIMAGATKVIVGRPVTEARSPYDAVRRILDEINEALHAKARMGSGQGI